MRDTVFEYNRGQVAFLNSMKKFSDDKLFMDYVVALNGQAAAQENSSVRQVKQAAMEEWKRGYREAREEAEKPKEPVAKKTTKKKTTKKKTSKKKISKKASKK